MSQEAVINRGIYARVSWKLIAVLSVLVAASCVVTLVLLVALTDADALTATALALAILAFSAQLIVYVAQVADSSDTRRQAASINTATQASLAQITTRVENSDLLIRDQHKLVLDTVLQDVRESRRRAKDEGKDFDLLNELSEREAEDGPTLDPHGHLTDDELDEIYDLTQWPDDEESATASVAILDSLHPVALGQLVRFATDWRESQLLGDPPGILYDGPEEAPFTSQLIEAGLVELTGRHPRGRPPKERMRPEYAVISDRGRKAARLLMGFGSAPEFIRAMVEGTSGTKGHDA